jgi:hypothetical protein
MGSSGGSANPMYLSQGGVPIPRLPIAGQGAPNDTPQNFGQFQEFLPEISPQGRAGYQIMPAGQGPNPSATGLTADMFRYRSPNGAVTPAPAAAAGGGGDDLRQQLAALQSQVNQFGAAREEQPGFGQYAQKSGVGFPINWTNSNNPNVTS